MSDKLQVRTVRVELLRSGPPHNQLLSPLTPYLGICGDSPAGVVHVPYEHAVFERRLADLRYTGISDMRLAQLRDTGVDMGRMLAAVPGLPGSVSSELQSQAAMIHLRVTLSASELALLPFELSKVPITADDESEAWLALQTKPPVCITRHIRTVSSEGVTWPSRARILFVSGAASDIPFDAHRRALEQAIAPYRYPRRDDPIEGIDSRHVHYGELLTIIENASLDDLVTAFRSARYTHVHVLAHGAIDFSSKGKPFGIRLRGRNGGTDVVSGERFATALARVDDDCVHRPFVVTLASCDSGLVANVVEPAPGASFAHTLHQSGIPLVVGSQFPLTKDGSVTVVELFYNGMLRGVNPHVLAHQTRSELHARYGADTHDWASLVVYEALPTSMDAQLERVCYEQGRLRLNAALERVDIAVSEAGQSLRAADDFDALEADVQSAIAALPDDGAYSIECRGLRASAMKRVAQATFVYGAMSGSDNPQLSRTCDRLEDALATYRTASEMFLRNDASVVQRMATLHWVAVQQLVMQAVLRQPLSEEVLAVASHAATLYLDHPSREERAWAHASLAELSLLRLAMGASSAADSHAATMRAHLEKIIAMFPAEQRFELSSTAKQFRRYVEWWGAPPFEQFVDARQVHGKARPWDDTARVVAEAEKAAHLLTASIPQRKGGPAVPTAREPQDVLVPSPASPSATLGRTADRKRRARPAQNAFLDVQMLPADWGDCLWIEYGTDPRRPSRILVDCGTRGTGARLLSRIDALPEPDRSVELFILTHIDDDHIGGAIPLLEAELGGLKAQDVWFNGYKHLAQFLGAEQGERFSSLIAQNGLPWNKWTDGRAIVIEGDTLPEHTLPGGMKLTLLSPTVEKLDALRARWEQELRAKNLVPGAGVDPVQLMGSDRDDLLGADDHGESTDVDAMAALPFKSDEAAPNGSSIAVLAEFEGKSILLAADAHAPVLEASIRRLLDARGGDQLSVGALKVSHHGSHGNTSPELLAMLDCRQFLISTNGKKFNHPHRPTISRIVKSGPHPQLSFNYVSKGKNDVWAREDLQERYTYSAAYPQTPHGLVVKL